MSHLPQASPFPLSYEKHPDATIIRGGNPQPSHMNSSSGLGCRSPISVEQSLGCFGDSPTGGMPGVGEDLMDWWIFDKRRTPMALVGIRIVPDEA
jgi:hypothetical protein